MDTLFAYFMVELLLFPVTHHFIITSCMHDYSPFISVLTPAAPFVPLLYPCSVLILFRCYARVYITLHTPSNNSFIQVRSYNVYRYTFVSDLFPGSISDKEIVRRSGLLRLFEVGDSIMADRGFDIEDDIAPLGVCVNIPPFLKGKQQFDSKDL